MSFYIDADEILQEFQMTRPVTGLNGLELESYDPVLPANSASSKALALTQLTLEPGGFDEVNRANWFTKVEVAIGQYVSFAGKRWEVSAKDNYDESGFSNLRAYRLIEVDSLQSKEVPHDKWR